MADHEGAVRSADALGMSERFDPIGRNVLSAHQIAATVTAALIVTGLSWVLLTDVVLYGVIHDQMLISRIETAKGWIFVLLTGLLVYGVTARIASRLHRVQRLTAAIVESIGDGVLLLGPDRRIAHANPSAVQMLRTPLRDLVGMDAKEFSRRYRVSYADGGLVKPERLMSQRVFDESGPMSYKAVLHPPEANPLVIRATAAAVRTETGRSTVWVVSLMHDITSDEHLRRLRDRFFAAAAHSLKTPVAIIKCQAQVLIPSLSEEQRRAAASIERQCDRIDRLVQNLQVLGRVRTKSLELHLEDLELGPLVERIAGEPVWRREREVSTEVAGRLRIYGDHERIGLVLRNLMNEATRLARAGSPITLLGRTENGQVSVGVRFRRVSGYADARELYVEYDDIGLGRSVAEAIVDSHGGSLDESESGDTTTAWIHLPAAQEAAG